MLSFWKGVLDAFILSYLVLLPHVFDNILVPWLQSILSEKGVLVALMFIGTILTIAYAVAFLHTVGRINKVINGVSKC